MTAGRSVLFGTLLCGLMVQCFALKRGARRSLFSMPRKKLPPSRVQEEEQQAARKRLEDQDVERVAKVSKAEDKLKVLTGYKMRGGDCVPCWLSDRMGARLYIKEPTVGAGSRMQNFIYTMAFAAKNGLNYGGAMPSPGHSEQNIAKLMAQLFGLEQPEKLFFTEGAPDFANTFHSVREIEDSINNGTIEARADYLLDPIGLFSVDMASVHQKNTDTFFTPEFLNALRKPTAPIMNVPLLWEDPKKPHMALHVRRGDLHFGDAKAAHRMTPDEWYFKVVDKVRASMPDIEVHVFSSLNGPNGEEHSRSEFDEYEKRGMHLHLDGDVSEAWAHFARADVVVLAKSSFSYTPAMLNSNCVIYQKHWLPPMPNWVEVTDGHKPQSAWTWSDKKMAKCLEPVKEKSDPRVEPRARLAIASEKVSQFKEEWEKDLDQVETLRWKKQQASSNPDSEVYRHHAQRLAQATRRADKNRAKVDSAMAEVANLQAELDAIGTPRGYEKEI